jgi:hypothetical protein
MLRTIKVLASLAAATPLLIVLACSSSSGGGGGSSADCNSGGADGGMCTPGSTPPYTACIDTTTPTVSFAKDIQPTLNTSCSISTPGTCHAMQQPGNSTPYLIFLGSPDGGIDGGDVLKGIVGVKAAENPDMNLVTAGDPDNSYLMHKLDYDQCQYSTTCNATKNPTFLNCGIGMPYQSGILDQPTRDNFRRWIAQGAKNN